MTIRWFCCTTNHTAAIVVAVLDCILAVVSITAGAYNYYTIFAAFREPTVPSLNNVTNRISNSTGAPNSTARQDVVNFINAFGAASISSTLSITGLSLLAAILLLIGTFKKNTCLTLLWVVLNAVLMVILVLGFVACIVGLATNFDAWFANIVAELNEHEQEVVINVFYSIKMTTKVLVYVLVGLVLVRLWFMMIVLGARREIQNERKKQFARRLLSRYPERAMAKNNVYNDRTVIVYPTRSLRELASAPEVSNNSNYFSYANQNFHTDEGGGGNDENFYNSIGKSVLDKWNYNSKA